MMTHLIALLAVLLLCGAAWHNRQPREASKRDETRA
jgi:hypothetical protein